MRLKAMSWPLSPSPGGTQGPPQYFRCKDSLTLVLRVTSRGVWPRKFLWVSLSGPSESESLSEVGGEGSGHRGSSFSAWMSAPEEGGSHPQKRLEAGLPHRGLNNVGEAGETARLPLLLPCSYTKLETDQPLEGGE